MTTNEASPVGQEPVDEEERVGFEIMEVVGDGTIRAWGSADLSQEEFDAIELPAGWFKNQPREGPVDDGRFFGSPGANGVIVEEELFGHRWEHWATVTSVGVRLDDGGALAAATVEKDHEISFDPGRTLSLLVSPEGDIYVQVSRDAQRATDEPTIPAGWEIVDHIVPDGYTTRLSGETLVIRMDNQDSYQGPVSDLDLTQ